MKKEEIYEILQQVPDPEIPVLTIEDLGIIRDVNIQNDHIEVIITPTYSGCPAMDMIAVNIKAALQEAGHHNVTITTVLAPAWTTDWMSAAGREKLRAYGIAPPRVHEQAISIRSGTVNCPQCSSPNTEVINQFGSTACKSLRRCLDCLEPFDHFKEF